MIRTGRVVEAEQGRLKVCFDRPETCEKCGACMGKAHKELVTVTGEAFPGDTVEVELPDSRVLKASFLMYAVPLCGFLLGLILGQVLIGTDLAAALLGLAGLLLTYGALHLFDKKIGKKGDWQPRVVAVHPSDAQHETCKGEKL